MKSQIKEGNICYKWFELITWVENVTIVSQLRPCMSRLLDNYLTINKQLKNRHNSEQPCMKYLIPHLGYIS